MDELDRILLDEPPIEPSAGFAKGVMRSVALASASPPPLPFPWVRVLAGAAACGALVLIGTLLPPDLERGVWTLVAHELEPVMPHLGYTAVTLGVVLGVLGLQGELAATD